MAAMDHDIDDYDGHDWVGLADLAEHAATQAAALLRDGLDQAQVEIETKSTGTDMVSEMDRAAERLIVDLLLAARPDDGILGEEGAARTGTSGLRWVIDPLDGTTNYLYRHPGFSVSIGVEPIGAEPGETDLDRGRRAGAGVVLDILTGDCFRAVRGEGATRNGEPITVSAETDLARALVSTGFGYAPERRQGQVAVLSRVIAQIRDIRRVGSAALDLCSVACGRVDALYELGLAPWDRAAGVLIAAEAGAVITYLPSSEPGAMTTVAAPAALSDPLISLLTTDQGR